MSQQHQQGVLLHTSCQSTILVCLQSIAVHACVVVQFGACHFEVGVAV